MKTVRTFSIIILVVLWLTFNLPSQPISLDTTISIDPRTTYLLVNNDPALDAIPINLVSMGIIGGNYLILQRLGDYDNGPGGDTFTGLLGLFSRNDSLLEASQLHRVPGALDAGEDYITANTYWGNLPTDIPEDFRIDSLLMQVPDSAQFIFLSPTDQLFYDNSDPNNNYAVKIQIGSPPVGMSASESDLAAHTFNLYPNFPNPFNPSTSIQFQLLQQAWITLKIYDPLGKEIETLINEQLPAGDYEKIWQPGNLPSGIYFYQLKTDEFQTVKKMILMR